MPSREDCSGNSSHGHCGEVSFRQTSCQTGVLHANFNGKGNSFFPAHTSEASKGESQEITKTVVEHNNQNDNAGGFQNVVAANCDNTSDNERNCNTGNCGQVIGSSGCQFGKEVLNCQA